MPVHLWFCDAPTSSGQELLSPCWLATSLNMKFSVTSRTFQERCKDSSNYRPTAKSSWPSPHLCIADVRRTNVALFVSSNRRCDCRGPAVAIVHLGPWRCLAATECVLWWLGDLGKATQTHKSPPWPLWHCQWHSGNTDDFSASDRGAAATRLPLHTSIWSNSGKPCSSVLPEKQHPTYLWLNRNAMSPTETVQLLWHLCWHLKFEKSLRTEAISLAPPQVPQSLASSPILESIPFGITGLTINRRIIVIGFTGLTINRRSLL